MLNEDVGILVSDAAAPPSALSPPQDLSDFEKIRKIAFLEIEFTVGGGELTISDGARIGAMDFDTWLVTEGLEAPVSFTARTGEIVGLTGQLGSGASAAVQALAGRRRVTAASISRSTASKFMRT